GRMKRPVTVFRQKRFLSSVSSAVADADLEPRERLGDAGQAEIVTAHPVEDDAVRAADEAAVDDEAHAVGTLRLERPGGLAHAYEERAFAEMEDVERDASVVGDA